MVYEAIDRGNHHSLVRENFIPVGKWLIGGDQQRTVLVAGTDELEQNAGLGVILVNEKSSQVNK